MIEKALAVLFCLSLVSNVIGESGIYVLKYEKNNILNASSSTDLSLGSDSTSSTDKPLVSSYSTNSTDESTASSYSTISTDDTSASSYSTGPTDEPPSSSDFSTTSDEPSSSTALGCDCGKNSVSCILDDNGDKICLCEDGFAQIKDVCVDCSCGKQTKNCFFDNQYQKICICQKGYAQNNGVCSATCEYDVECLNGGLCKFNKDGTGFCECRRDFAGDKCDINNICKRLDAICYRYGAICAMRDGLPICECPPGKEMDKWGNCKSLCDSVNCVHGSCEIMGYSYICRCDDGFVGPHCDKKEIPYEPIKYNGLLITIMVLLILIVLVVVGFLCITIFIRKKKSQLFDSESSKLVH